MVKRAVLVHGWNGSPKRDFHPWLRRELEFNGFKVWVPPMPGKEHPKMTQWLGVLSKTIGNTDKDLFLVGHSLGCIAILRYLERSNIKQALGGAVLVAGFSDNKGFENDSSMDSFFQSQIDFESVQSHCKEFVAIHSDNDPYVSLRYADTFKRKLNAKIIIEHNMKHFSSKNGNLKVPSILNSILDLSKKVR